MEMMLDEETHSPIGPLLVWSKETRLLVDIEGQRGQLAFQSAASVILAVEQRSSTRFSH